MLQRKRNVMNVILGSFLLNFIYIIPISAEGPTELKRMISYPSKDSDIFFKPIVCIDVLGNQFYCVNNLDNKVIRFEITHPEITYLSDLGRPGQGPGDLMHPMYLSIWQQRICIKDGGAFSFFEKNGKFISRFKAFEGNDVFVYRDRKIFWLNPKLNENQLIDVYNEEGLRVRSFGGKNLKVDSKAFLNPPSVLSEVYSGSLLADANALYYFNARFGYYEAYTFDGQLTQTGSINDGFGERGKRIPEFNSARYIERTKDIKERSGYPLPVVFERAFMNEGSIYFAGTRIVGKGESTIIEFRKFSADTMMIGAEYFIKKAGVCRLDAFAVIINKGKRLFLLAITNLGEGYYLELYNE